MKKVLVSGACLAISMSMHSCRPDYNANVTPGSLSSLNDVYNQLNLKPKTLTVDAATGGHFFGNSGTHYYFAPNSFQTANGTSVTGQVQIDVCEYLKEGDMIFSGMLPISNNEPLLSGGEIYVKASQQSQPVYLKPGYNFRATVPTFGTPPTGMKLFMGQPGTDPTRDKVNWIMRDTAAATAKDVGVFHSVGDSLGIISDSLKLCNADQFLTSPNYQTFTVAITVSGATLSSSSTVQGYALYDTYKGVYPLGRSTAYSNGIFKENHLPNIPIHFVAFTLINGKFYGGTLGATPSTGSTYTMTLSEVDPVTFKQQLNDF